jgi:dTMP kinase
MIELGKSIVLEGNDGTGKSTQVELLKDTLASDYGIESLVIHEPDGPGISAEIRTIIKNGSFSRDAITNLLLFTASRHESNLLAEEAMENGLWVLKARDWSSSEAYQGGGEGLDPEFIRNVTRQFTTERYMNPDLKVILTLEDELRKQRISSRGELENPDTFEQRGDDFQLNVNHTYKIIAAREKFDTINASQTVEEVHDEIMQLLYVKNLLVPILTSR